MFSKFYILIYCLILFCLTSCITSYEDEKSDDLITSTNTETDAKNFTATANYIIPKQIHFKATTDVVSQSSSYHWDFNGVEKVTNNPDIDYTFPETGKFPVTLTITSSNGETTSISHNVYVANALDPHYEMQWHLHNTAQTWPLSQYYADSDASNITAGEDINVIPVWDSCGVLDTCRGEGIYIAVVDDAIEIGHEDLAANVDASLSHSYASCTASNDPSPNICYNPSNNDNHGTMVAGITAAVGLNDLGVQGVAPRVNLVGYNFLSNQSLVNEIDTIERNQDIVDINTNSWGVGAENQMSDCNKYRNPSNLVNNRILVFSKTARNGKGRIYLWAAGNSGKHNLYNNHPSEIFCDNTNNSGITNLRTVITVAALDQNGKRSSYSTPGSSILISAPAGEYCNTHTIVTIDRTMYGQNTSFSYEDVYKYNFSDEKYTYCMNGTSSATPIVAGVTALILQANPELTARDVRTILATTARKNDNTSTNYGEYWQQNAAGYWYNINYGFGAVDAAKAVNAAKNWSLLPDEKLKEVTSTSSTSLNFSETNTVITKTINVSNSNINYIENIDLYFSLTSSNTDKNITFVEDKGYYHYGVGNVLFQLISPSGTRVLLNSQSDDSNSSITWTYTTPYFMGEKADGNWILNIYSKGYVYANLFEGTLNNYKLSIYGH